MTILDRKTILAQLSSALRALDARIDNDSLHGNWQQLKEDLQPLREFCAAETARAKKLGQLVLILGPSGSGKSTLFNHLVGRDVSRVSSISRPSTRGALSSLSGEDARNRGHFETMELKDATANQEIMAGMAGTVTCLGLQTDLPFALIDAPDFDTHFLENRQVLERLLYWADAAIFVTCPERYGDQSAEPYFQKLAALETRTAFVFNKAHGEKDAELATEFAEIRASQLGRDLKDFPLVVIRDLEDLNQGEASIGLLDILSQHDSVEHSLKARTRALESELKKKILYRLDAHRRWVEGLKKVLSSLTHQSWEFHPTQSIRRLSQFEEQGKFWLRYSHRNLFRSIIKGIRNPKTLIGKPLQADKIVEEPLCDLISDQACDILQDLQMRIREAVKAYPDTESILEGSLKAGEFSPSIAREQVAVLSTELQEFSDQRIQALKSNWEDKTSPLARAKSWAVDKVIRLIALGLSVTLIPPLLHELLRFIGHPEFSNEVTAEFDRVREKFAKEMAELGHKQVSASIEAIEHSSIAAELVEGFRDNLAALEGVSGS